MSARILFISDLHLEPGRPDITATLLRFLADQAGRCDALYILGDLFEVWLGDDDVTPLADTVATALHGFHTAGAAVYLMHGNRDFLLGQAFASRCGASLVAEPYLLQGPTGPILLLHGDTLCTDDHDYQRFRAQVRAPSWQAEFLAKPLAARQAFAQRARAESRVATASKAMAIMDVNPQAVLNLLQQHQQVTLLHGHTHRPAMHPITLATPIKGHTQATRIVLGSWEERGWVAEADHAGIRLVDFPLAAA